jgi:hypothetical protein
MKQVENIYAALSSVRGRNGIVAVSSVQTRKERVMILCKVMFLTLNIYHSSCNKMIPHNVMLDLQK